MSDAFDYDVFLSHNSKDKPAVRALAQALRAHGLEVWFDEDELEPGRPWQPLIEAGIKGSRTCAVVIGKAGIGPWEDEEMQAALDLAVHEKKKIFAVLLPGAPDRPELSIFLTNRTWVDLRAGFTEDGLGKLIWGITGKKPKKIESGTGPSTSGEVVIAPSRLRHGAEHLFGRDKELAALDSAWANPKIRILTMVAWGGVGKTSLVAHWMTTRDVWNHPDFERVFDWSFYSQGTREQGAASADTFVAEALKFFGDEQMAASAASPWDKGARLAKLVAEHRTLLVLDGVEPLQYPPGPQTGELKDTALQALLKGLAQRNPGLCVVTTREHVADLAPFRETTAPEWKLEHLTEEAGAALLHQVGAKRAGAAEIKENDSELRDASQEVGGHALTLRILGNYLALAHDGDIRKRDVVDFADADREFITATTDEEKAYGHAFKMIGTCEKWLAGGGENGERQLAILRLLGLFDRPASPECLKALRKKPAIKGLSEPLVGISDAQWNTTLTRLAACGFITVPENRSSIDAHPLIREYFAKQRREKNPTGWRAAHKRLYEHLTETTEYRPNTLEGLLPLYQAVAHGCQAGLHQKACDEVYSARILRGTGSDGFYSTKKLGAFGADLGAVSCFFELPWNRLAPGISETDQAWLLTETAFRLRALGRLTEALEPMRAALEWACRHEDWEHAAVGASNLSELELTLGKVADAVRDAENSVEYADRSGDAFQRLSKRTTHADALHHAGQNDKALARFREAENMQAENQPEYPLLYSVQGFQYCDLLLAEAERAAWPAAAGSAGGQPVSKHGQAARASLIASCREVEQRAAQTLKWAKESSAPLLSMALDHLTLGRAALYRAVLTDSKTEQTKGLKTANQELTAAVDGLRRAGDVEFIVRSLLSRAWLQAVEGDTSGARADLDEAWQIAGRGPMPLFMADIYLYRARLFFREEKYPWTSPKDDLAAARKLIEQCGYHRRDAELADAEAAIA